MSDNLEKIHLYTDGACNPNPGPAAVGVLLKYKNYQRKIGKYLGQATNNIAELTAIRVALEEVKEEKRNLPVVIYTDSQYSIGVLTNLTWKPKKNKELIIEIKDMINSFDNLTFEWVKGHSSNEGNITADELAVEACSSKKDRSSYAIS